MRLKERAPALALTARDVALLCDIARFGALRRGQIQDIHFPDCAVRRCNRRLQALTQARLITGFPLTPAGIEFFDLPASPSVQRAYRLTATGADIAAPLLGWEVAPFKRTLRQGTPGYLAHALTIADVYVTLRNAERSTAGFTLRRFLVERQAHHSYELRDTEKPDAPWRTEVFKPDAYAHLAAPDGERHSFFEVDLGHTGSEEFGKKLAIHDRYRNTGLFARRYGAATFLTLILTTTERRIANLKRLAENAHCPNVRLTTLAAFYQRFPGEGLSAPIWRTPFREGESSLCGAENASK